MHEVTRLRAAAHHLRELAEALALGYDITVALDDIEFRISEIVQDVTAQALACELRGRGEKQHATTVLDLRRFERFRRARARARRAGGEEPDHGARAVEHSGR
jgi:hypothetical protein